MRAERRVFVVGAYIPNGGTLMAYHVGRISGRLLRAGCVAVQVERESAETSIFPYPDRWPSIGLPELAREIRDDDLLIANPSFSDHLFGLRLPGKKLMYVQDFKTFRVIDGFFDAYVAVSPFVRDLIRMSWAIDLPVIPAFIHDAAFAAPRIDFAQRPEASIFAYPRIFGRELLERLLSTLARKHGIALELSVPGAMMPREQLFATMAAHRYFLCVSPFEGFGATPLEAMACGCAVVGFDGGGGREFMTSGVNCETVAYPDVDGVAARLVDLLRSPGRAAELAAAGQATASEYRYEVFEERWTRFLNQLFFGTWRLAR